jgi:hypothetical protein
LKRRTLKADDDVFIKAWFYGDPGAWKTSTAYNFAGNARTGAAIALNAHGNPESTRAFAQLPAIFDVSALDDLNPVYNWLKSGQNAAAPFAVTNELGTALYQTVIIDTITEVQRISNKTVTGNNRKGPGDTLLPAQIQHHGQIFLQTTNILDLFFDLPMHVIMVAWQQRLFAGDGEVVGYRPFFTGQTADVSDGYGNLTGRFVQIKDIPRKEREALRIPSTARVVVFWEKDQISAGKLGDFMVDPTADKIISAVYAD